MPAAKGDTGSPEVQVAILTERIHNLTEHFKSHAQGQPFAPRPADDGQQAPLAARLSQARRTTQRYTDLIAKLGLRK